MKVLLWGDFDLHYRKALAEKIKLENQSITFYCDFEPYEFKNAKSLSQYYAVILMVTDVTKFSSSDKERDKICDSLIQYAENGGRLIVSHDILYHRCRNKKLQFCYGYSIDRFQRAHEKKVEYIKTKNAWKNPYFLELPDVFEMDDGEICWGNSPADAEIFFETKITDPITKKEERIPLALGKTCKRGNLFYFNSGDMFKDDLPGSIKNGDPNLIKLIDIFLRIDLHEKKGISEEMQIKLLTNAHKCEADRPFVFVSYSHERALQIAIHVFMMQSLGLNVWLDIKDAVDNGKPGDSGWKRAVSDALASPNCKGAMVFLDENFLNSEQCCDEIKQIMQRSLSNMILRFGTTIPMIVDLLMKLPYLEKSATQKADVYKKFLALDKQNKLTRVSFEAYKRFDYLRNVQLKNQLKEWGMVLDDALVSDSSIAKSEEEIKRILL